MDGSSGGFGDLDGLDGLIGFLDNEDQELQGLSPTNSDHDLQDLLAQEAPEWARSEDIPFEPDEHHHTQLDFLHEWMVGQDDYPSTSTASASSAMSQDNSSMPSCSTSSSKSTDESQSPHNTSTPDSMGPSTSSRSDSGEDDVGTHPAPSTSTTPPSQPSAPPSGPLWDLLMRSPSPAREKSTEDDEDVQVINDLSPAPPQHPAMQQGADQMPPPSLPPLRPEFISAVHDRVQIAAPQLAFSNDPLVNQQLNRYMHIGQTEVQLSPAVLRQQKIDIVKKKRKKTEKKTMEDSRYYVPRAAAEEARQRSLLHPVMSDNLTPEQQAEALFRTQNGHFHQSLGDHAITNIPYGTESSMAQGGLMQDQPSTSRQPPPYSQAHQTWPPIATQSVHPDCHSASAPGQSQSAWMQQQSASNAVQYPQSTRQGPSLFPAQSHSYPNSHPGAQAVHQSQRGREFHSQLQSGTWRPQAQWGGRTERSMHAQSGQSTTTTMTMQQPLPSGQHGGYVGAPQHMTQMQPATSGQQGSSWPQQQLPLPVQQMHQPRTSSLSPEARRMNERARLQREAQLHELQRSNLVATRRRSSTLASILHQRPIVQHQPQTPVVRQYPQPWPEPQENPPHVQAHIERQRAAAARRQMQLAAAAAVSSAAGAAAEADVQPLAATAAAAELRAAVPSGSASSPIPLIDSNESSPATSPSEEEHTRPPYFSPRFTWEQAEVWAEDIAWEALIQYRSDESIPAYGEDGHYRDYRRQLDLVVSHRQVDAEMAAMGMELCAKTIADVTPLYYGGRPLSPSRFRHPTRPAEGATASDRCSGDEALDNGPTTKKARRSPDEPSTSRDYEPPQENHEDNDHLETVLGVIDVIVEEEHLEEALERSFADKEDQPCCSKSLD